MKTKSAKTTKRTGKKTKAKKAPLPTKKAAPRHAPRSERRIHDRIPAPTLIVRERSGDMQFLATVRDISRGGLFLLGRVQSGPAQAQLLIPTPAGPISIDAERVRDGRVNNGFGAGYRFLSLGKPQMKALDSLLRELQKNPAR